MKPNTNRFGRRFAPTKVSRAEQEIDEIRLRKIRSECCELLEVVAASGMRPCEREKALGKLYELVRDI